MVVVPPARADRVPEAKSSAVTVPIASRSRWVCVSTPPGTTRNPWQSTTSSPGRAVRSPISAMRPALNRTAASRDCAAVVTIPPVNKIDMTSVRALHLRQDAGRTLGRPRGYRCIVHGQYVAVAHDPGPVHHRVVDLRAAHPEQDVTARGLGGQR